MDIYGLWMIQLFSNFQAKRISPLLSRLLTLRIQSSTVLKNGTWQGALWSGLKQIASIEPLHLQMGQCFVQSRSRWLQASMEVKMHWQVCSSSFFLPAFAMEGFIANVGPGDVMAQFTQSQLIAQGTAANLSHRSWRRFEVELLKLTSNHGHQKAWCMVSCFLVYTVVARNTSFKSVKKLIQGMMFPPFIRMFCTIQNWCFGP